jgi:hypothetical protein
MTEPESNGLLRINPLTEGHVIGPPVQDPNQVPWFYRTRWVWRISLIAVGLFIIVVGVRAIVPPSPSLGTLAVTHVTCHGSPVCDVSGSFREDGSADTIPFVSATVVAAEGIDVGSVVRVAEIDEVRVTTDLNWRARPDYTAIVAVIVGVGMLAMWIVRERRVARLRPAMRRLKAAQAGATMASGTSLLGGPVFREEQP